MTSSADPELSNKKLAAGLLGIFLGAFGIHKFVLGYTTSGVIGLIEGIIYLTKTPDEFRASYIDAKKEWF
jgi:TM2 domain-containing membrane protein YozV